MRIRVFGAMTFGVGRGRACSGWRGSPLRVATGGDATLRSKARRRRSPRHPERPRSHVGR